MMDKIADLNRPQRIHRSVSLQQPTVTLTMVTPAMAADWLNNTNLNNRHVTDAYVQRLARDMKAGNWRLTHEGIAFDPDGILLDGQHRLRAIVMARIPIEMYVWRNVGTSALMAIDCGKPRSITDILRLSGNDEVTKNHIAVLRTMLGGFNYRASGALSAAEVSRELGQHGEAIGFSIDALRQYQRGVATAVTRGVIARAFYTADRGRLRTFSEILASGIVPELGVTANVILLRNFLLGKSTGDSGSTRHAQYAKTERALVAFLRGERLTRLHAVTCEQFPLPGESDDSNAST